VDADFEKDSSGIVNYKDPEIGLKLPVEDIIISDYDKNAN
jgi:dTDP-4-dehydrorhamnose 3,5-epimerase-like enzyme